MRIRGLGATAGHFKRPGEAKRSFDTKAEAQVFATRHHCKPYVCSLCEKWHIGHRR